MNKKLLVSSALVLVVGLLAVYMFVPRSTDLSGLPDIYPVFIIIAIILVAAILAGLGLFWSSIKKDNYGTRANPLSIGIVLGLFAVIAYLLLKAK